LLSHLGESQYAGNEGYQEDPRSYYEYDSNVGNCRQLKVGDQVVICTRSEVLGQAIIEAIEDSPDTKIVRRCPICSNSNLKMRKTRTPLYRCDNKHEFDEPIVRHVNVTKFTARYGGTFQPIAGSVDARTAKQSSLTPRGRSSIRPIDPTVLRLLVPVRIGSELTSTDISVQDRAGGSSSG
jgi:hypothetical protein